MLSTAAAPAVTWAWLGRVPYATALALQEHVHSRVAAKTAPSTLLLMEHPHVYTVGRSLREDAATTAEAGRLQKMFPEVDFHRIQRGGNITYHGPGILMGYPIIRMDEYSLRTRKYVEMVVESLSLFCQSSLGVAAKVADDDAYTGVWSPDGHSKLCAVGFEIKKAVSMHGFALSLDPELKYFDAIVPCGLQDKRAGSIAQELATTPLHEDMATVANRLPPFLASTWSNFTGLDIRMLGAEHEFPAWDREIREFVAGGAAETRQRR